jgi:hypothetical protein
VNSTPSDHVVVIANELRVMREAIGSTLADLRPEIRFLIIDPADLLPSVRGRAPDLVILSNLDLLDSFVATSWLLLPSNDGSSFLVSLAGRPPEVRRGGFHALIEAVDEAVRIGKMTE